jgi:hypothetical protein
VVVGGVVGAAVQQLEGFAAQGSDGGRELSHLARVRDLPVLAVLDTAEPQAIAEVNADATVTVALDEDRYAPGLAVTVSERDLGTLSETNLSSRSSIRRRSARKSEFPLRLRGKWGQCAGRTQRKAATYPGTPRRPRVVAARKLAPVRGHGHRTPAPGDDCAQGRRVSCARYGDHTAQRGSSPLRGNAGRQAERVVHSHAHDSLKDDRR